MRARPLHDQAVRLVDVCLRTDGSANHLLQAVRVPSQEVAVQFKGVPLADRAIRAMAGAVREMGSVEDARSRTSPLSWLMAAMAACLNYSPASLGSNPTGFGAKRLAQATSIRLVAGCLGSSHATGAWPGDLDRRRHGTVVGRSGVDGDQRRRVSLRFRVAIR